MACSLPDEGRTYNDGNLRVGFCACPGVHHHNGSNSNLNHSHCSHRSDETNTNIARGSSFASPPFLMMKMMIANGRCHCR